MTEDKKRENYLNYWNSLYSKETLRLIKVGENNKFEGAIQTLMTVLTNLIQSPI